MLKAFLLSVGLTFGLTQISLAQDIDMGEETEPEIKLDAFFNRTEFNFSNGFLKHNQSWLIGLRNVVGYKFSPYVAFGLGLGLEKYGSAYENEKISDPTQLFLPVYSDL